MQLRRSYRCGAADAPQETQEMQPLQLHQQGRPRHQEALQGCSQYGLRGNSMPDNKISLENFKTCVANMCEISINREL